MMRRLAGLLGAAVLLAPTAAAAQAPSVVPGSCGRVEPGPYAYAVVGGTCANISPFMSLDASSGLFRLAAGDMPVGSAMIGSLTATFDADPFIAIAASTTNLTAGPTTYSFIFGTPIVPGFYSRATSTGSATVTPGQGPGTMAQNGAEEFVSIFGSTGPVLTSLGVDVGTGSCAADAAPTTCDYPPGGGVAARDFPPLFFDNLELVLTYTQTGIGSQVTWTARGEILQASPAVVPEPATAGLVLAGLMSLLGARTVRRRRER